MAYAKRVPTAVSIMALKVLTTREQPEQSTELVEVTVLSKTVLVPSSGNANTGCDVVQVVWPCALVAAKRVERRTIANIIL